MPPNVAYRLGCNTFQIFSSSPRQWAPVMSSARPHCAEIEPAAGELRSEAACDSYNYLVNWPVSE